MEKTLTAEEINNYSALELPPLPTVVVPKVKDKPKRSMAVWVEYVDESGEAWVLEDLTKMFANANPERRRELLDWKAHLIKKVHEVSQIPPLPEAIHLDNPSSKASFLAAAMNSYSVKAVSREVYIYAPAIVNSFALPPMEPDALTTFIHNYVDKTYKFSKEGNFGLTNTMASAGVSILKAKEQLLHPGYIIKLNMPYPDLDGKERRNPTYYPMYDSIPFWFEWFLKYQTGLVSGKFARNTEDVKKYVDFYKKCVNFVKRHYFGSGTPLGQMGRFTSVAEIRAIALKNINAVSDYRGHVKRACKGLRRRPIALPELIGSDIFQILAQRIETKDGSYEIRKKTNWQASAGVMWTSGEKKAEVYLQDFTLARELLRDLSLLASGFQKPDAFWSKWAFTRLVGLMAKSEVYELNQRTTKTRNITIYNSFCMLPAHLAVYNYMYELETTNTQPYIFGSPGDPEATGTGTFNGSGLSPFGGGVNRLVQERVPFLMEQDLRGLCFTYADNAYVMQNVGGKVLLASIDASKMEASITKELVIETMRHITLEYARYGAIDSTWSTYLMSYFPILAVEAVAVFGNQEIPMNSMGSGTVGTFLFNTVAMMVPLTVWFDSKNKDRVNLFQDGQVSSSFLNTLLKFGVVPKVEQVLTVSPTIEHMELDMLGFGAHRFQVDAKTVVYLPVLMENRLLGTLLYRKKHYDRKGKPKLPPLVQTFIDLIRYKAIYYCGGWVSEAIYKPLQRFAAAAKINFKRMLAMDEEDESNDLTDEQKIELAIQDPELVSTFSSQMISTLLVSSLPTIYELVLVGTGDERLALRAVRSRWRKVPPKLLAPTSVLKDKFDYSRIEEDERLTTELGLKEMPMPSELSVLRHDPTKTPQLFAGEVSVMRLDAPKLGLNPTMVTPDLPPKPVKVKKKKKTSKTQTNEENIKKIMSDLNRRQLYRVPVPPRYYLRTANIKTRKDETMVAKSQMVLNIMQETGLSRPEALQMVNNARDTQFILKHVKFDPVNMTRNPADRSKVYVSAFELHDGPLYATKITPRMAIVSVPPGRKPKR